MFGTAAQAEDITVKIGVLTDFSGLYTDDTGLGSLAAAKMAVQDFDPAAHGMKVEIVSADHQNKPDLGSSIARQWFDVDHVDAIVDVPTSSVALAVNEVVREKNKVFLVSGAAISDLTGPKCSPNTVHWTYDTWMLANSTGKSLVKSGGDTWFFLTADYAFGHALERDTTAVVKANGGQVFGSVAHPLSNQDFSSFLLQAQNLEGQNHRARQCRRRHHQRHQAGRRVRHPAGRAALCRAAGLSRRRPGARLEGGAGPCPDRNLLLGHERRHPRLDQALAGRAAGQIPQHEPGRQSTPRPCIT